MLIQNCVCHSEPKPQSVKLTAGSASLNLANSGAVVPKSLESSTLVHSNTRQCKQN